MDHDNRRKWHFDREISVGDAIGLVVAFTAVMVAYGTLSTRISLVEQSQIAQAAYISESVSRMEATILKIDQKLDRLIERNGR